MGYSEQFKAFREARGVSSEELARRARCHRNTVVNVESGRPVKFATLLMLMETLGYKPESRETKLLAVLWLEAITGVRVSLNDTPRATAEKANGSRTASRASDELQAEVAQRRLKREDVELLTFAARHRKVLHALKAIHELLDDGHHGGLSSARG
jgi:transcriptional regulator with XRE-family HTH domain